MAEWQTQLQIIVNSTVGIFMAPGEFILQQVAELFPDWLLVSEGDAAILPAVVSLFFWLTAAIVLRKMIGEVRNLFVYVRRLTNTLLFRFQIRKTYLGTRISRFWQQRLLRRRSDSGLVANEIEFDRLDLAVLRSAASCGPGFAIAAPEVAEALGILPNDAQRRLEKLSHSQLLELTGSASDDFTNYRLTRTGQRLLSATSAQA